MTTKFEILKSIRSKCLDCSVGSSAEVKLCPKKDCSLWPFRFGRDPNPARGKPGFGDTVKKLPETPYSAVEASGHPDTNKGYLVVW
jgi:hypothetical protein